jgi:hypothetical protein
MGWSVRAATAADRAGLAAFSCDSGADCGICSPDGGNVHEREVEEYLQRNALDDQAARSPHNGHTLLLLLEPNGVLAGAIAHERFELLVRGAKTPAELIVVAGVRSDLHGVSVQGHRLSSHLLGACIRDLAEDPPSMLAGRVAVCNARSRRLLERHHIGLESSLSGADHVLIAGAYEDVLGTLPPPLTP